MGCVRVDDGRVNTICEPESKEMNVLRKGWDGVKERREARRREQEGDNRKVPRCVPK